MSILDYFRQTKPTKRAAVSSPGSVRVEREQRENRVAIERLVKEAKQDDQFKFAFLVIKSYAQEVQVTVDKPSHTASVALAEWNANLENMLDCFWFGRVAFELEKVPGERWSFNLHALPYNQTEMIIKDDGGFGGVKLKEDELKPDSCWWLAIDGRPDYPFGTSRIIGAAEAVLRERRRLAENEKIWYDRHAIGQGVARFPEPSGPDEDRIENHPKEKMREALGEVRSGGWILLSSQHYDDREGNTTNTPKYSIEPSEGLKDATALENRRQSLDDRALRSIGIPERALTQDSATGSYSLAEVHQRVLFALVDELVSKILNSYQKYVVDKLSVLNGEPVKLVMKGLRSIAEERSKDVRESQQQIAIQQQPFQPRMSKSADAIKPQQNIADDLATKIDDYSKRLVALLGDPDKARKAVQDITSDERREL